MRKSLLMLMLLLPMCLMRKKSAFWCLVWQCYEININTSECCEVFVICHHRGSIGYLLFLMNIICPTCHQECAGPEVSWSQAQGDICTGSCVYASTSPPDLPRSGTPMGCSTLSPLGASLQRSMYGKRRRLYPEHVLSWARNRFNETARELGRASGRLQKNADSWTFQVQSGVHITERSGNELVC